MYTDTSHFAICSGQANLATGVHLLKIDGQSYITIVVYDDALKCNYMCQNS